jgi:hypothetical protein
MQRWMWMISALAVVPTLVAQQGGRTMPVGLVLGNGATIARGKAPAAAVKPGEVLLSGDTLKAAGGTVSFLYCPEKFSATLSAGGELVLTPTQAQVKSGELSARKTLNACFLPEVQKLSVASQQHYGVMMTRAGSIPPPKNTFTERVNGLSAEQKHEVQARVADAAGNDPVAQVALAVSLEKAGLLYDAGEYYRKASAQWPEVAWVKRKITEIEDALLKQQMKE